MDISVHGHGEDVGAASIDCSIVSVSLVFTVKNTRIASDEQNRRMKRNVAVR
jgi:uncharacterized protein YggE